MATKEKKQTKKRETKEMVQIEHTGKDLPVPPPRLRGYYMDTVRERLKSQFGFTNVHQIPTLEKIVINCGVGEAIKNPKVLDAVVIELGIITGQRPVRKKAKKSSQLRPARGPGDRLRGDAARRADVGVPRPLRRRGDPAHP